MALKGIGTANIVFGLLSLARLVTDALWFDETRHRAHLSTFATFDATVATLWILSGLCLRARNPDLMIAAMVAGVAAARSLLCLLIVGPVLLEVIKMGQDHWEFLPRLGVVSSQLLHHGIELLYWPVVLFWVGKACDAPRPRWQPHPGLPTSLSFAGAAVIGAIFQAALLAPAR
jgi:hypothetical protein